MDESVFEFALQLRRVVCVLALCMCGSILASPVWRQDGGVKRNALPMLTTLARFQCGCDVALLSVPSLVNAPCVSLSPGPNHPGGCARGLKLGWKIMMEGGLSRTGLTQEQLAAMYEEQNANGGMQWPTGMVHAGGRVMSSNSVTSIYSENSGNAIPRRTVDRLTGEGKMYYGDGSAYPGASFPNTLHMHTTAPPYISQYSMPVRQSEIQVCVCNGNQSYVCAVSPVCHLYVAFKLTSSCVCFQYYSQPQGEVMYAAEGMMAQSAPPPVMEYFPLPSPVGYVPW